jgi:D-alanyl-D-alanine carboxypeptidase
MNKIYSLGLSLLLLSLLFAGCSGKNHFAESDQIKKNQITSIENGDSKQESKTTEAKKETIPSTTNESSEQNAGKQEATAQENIKIADQVNTSTQKDGSIHVIAQPESIPVLVNKQNKLPNSYTPKDLVSTKVPFVSSATTEKRKMRSEAAEALANLFAGAKQQGVNLLGVSGYRSHSTQVNLFNYYVKIDGYEKARTYSALPGTSEHETGLSIDVTGGNGKCAAEDCFANTTEANWLQAHVANYGFIIRYPKGKDAITGYKYEPWHIRYVGKTIATEIMSKGSTLEEYYNTLPVNN